MERKLWTFDGEFLPNYALMGFRDVESGEVYKFEKWKNTNTIKTQMRKWMQKHIAPQDLIGTYNGKYDLMMLNLWEENEWDPDHEQIMDRSYKIIQEGKRFRRYDIPGRHADLQEILNLNKQTQVDGASSKQFISLKEACSNLGYHKVLDFPVDPDHEIDAKTKKKLYEYWLVDLEATEFLMLWAKKEIGLRLIMEQMHGVDVLNRGRPRMARQLLVAMYEKKTGKNAWSLREEYWGSSDPDDVKKMQQNTWFKFKDLIPGPKHFRWQHKEMQDAYDEMYNFKRQFFEKRFKHQFEMSGVRVTMGEGGAHDDGGVGIDEGVWMEDDNYKYFQVDASSFYPYIIHNRNYHPRHLPGIRDLFWEIVQDRLKWKAEGKKSESDAMKIVINSYYGMMGSDYSPFVDLPIGKATPLTGQLYLLQICDWFLAKGIDVLLINTDGVMVRVHKSKMQDFEKIIQVFSKVYKLVMDMDPLRGLVKKNVNSYLLLGQDEVLKGTKDFRTDMIPKSPPAGRIMARALVNYYAENIPVEETIAQANDIRDFLFCHASSKRTWKVGLKFPWSTEPAWAQNTMRWYVARDGGEIFREGIFNGKVFRLMKGIPVMPLLDIQSENPADYPNLNVGWYVEKTKEKLVKVE